MPFWRAGSRSTNFPGADDGACGFAIAEVQVCFVAASVCLALLIAISGTLVADSFWPGRGIALGGYRSLDQGASLQSKALFTTRVRQTRLREMADAHANPRHGIAQPAC